MGVPQGGQQRSRQRQLPAGQRGSELRRQLLRRPGQRRPAAVLGGQRVAPDRGSNKPRSGSQTTCRRHCTEAEINSVGVRQINRSSFTTHQPEVYTSTMTRHNPSISQLWEGSENLLALLRGEAVPIQSKMEMVPVRRR